MTDITRRTGSVLAKTAMQAGIYTEETAEWALRAGVRLLAHGFTDSDLDEMIRLYYRYGDDLTRRT